MPGMTICLALFAFSCNMSKKTTAKSSADYVSYVDPYIGSGEHGHVFVGANVPFGTIQAGPQNIHKGWDWCSGYHYSDSIIIGFSHTHLSGTGCADLGDILVMPFTGEVRTSRGEQDNIEGSCSSYYSHKNEAVSPGYYSLLMDNGVKAELTTTERVAMHRYHYPENQQARLLINLKEGNGDSSYDTYLKKTDDYTIEGYRFSHGWSPQHKVFFVLKSDKPINSLAVFNNDEAAGNDEITGKEVKGVLSFKDNPQDINIKIAISSVSCANALANMNAELPGWDFERVHQDAIAKWNKQLACVRIETQDERAKKIFYTALYHAFIAPTLYCDANGEFRGQDDKIYSNNTWTNYSTFSLWDTYRTLNPLYTIIVPEKVDDIVNSYLSIYDQQGKLPIWHLLGGETNCMPGYSSVPIIADAYLKGFKGFDAERAFQAMTSTATNDKQNGVTYVKEKGYIPCDKIHEATSIAMEYAADDWGTALMAKKMGKTDDYQTYLKRGKYYTQYFDKDINFIRPKMYDGSWRTPYNPFRSIHGVGDFTEGTGWQYTFFVPQHPEGLIELFGGDKTFVAKLDSLFIVEGDMGEGASSDISGLIGQYAHGNEPSHHIAYLYPYAGEQWKTAEKVRYIQDVFYTDQPEGIIGNEDCGQMSAWHIMSALGFYQVNPSNGVFVFGSPLFEKATIRLPEGKSFEITAQDNNKENIYIQSVTLNGQPYDKSYILYEDIMKGGNLTFIMGNTPNKQFGAAPESRPKTAD
nr:GH92 family glycosyl hydrolase [Parabacteroides sp. AM08-6]